MKSYLGHSGFILFFLLGDGCKVYKYGSRSFNDESNNWVAEGVSDGPELENPAKNSYPHTDQALKRISMRVTMQYGKYYGIEWFGELGLKVSHIIILELGYVTNTNET